jgi:hypothetical protein
MKTKNKKSRKTPLSAKAPLPVVTWIQSWVKASRAPWAEWAWNQSQQLAKSWSNAANWHSWSSAKAKPASRKAASSARAAR